VAAQPGHRAAGLGPAATFTLLGALTILLVIAAVSARLLEYAAPPATWPARRA
jgi:hypothetical protein